ncbi:restriction endonuclease [Ligilactobacillus saerimneri]|uniref:restriction endonuclease n=1 Tax=Ligilactobacillus saerimneri TaxID=228229 RepID=UPI0029430A28|nr:restriction endonuclease [Ligilactobacillus saerimneri]
MIDYTTLKHSSDGMPTWDAYLGIVLNEASKKGVFTAAELKQAAVNQVNLPLSLKNLEYSSNSGENVAINRAGWALSDLKIAGLLHSPERNQYQITTLGKKILADYGLSLTRNTVHSLPEYKKHKNSLKKKKNKTANVAITKTDLSETQIQEWFDDKKDNIQDELLNCLINMNPYKFEALMVQLLAVMGYKGDEGQSLVTQKSNDGGIDGIINQDPLGLQKVYIQVKRYTLQNTVSRPEITSFSGAIKLRHADRGVFITTSSFTSGAEEAARALNITLVNGDMLTNLMLQYHVGVIIQQQYNTYKLDRDAFSD